MKQTITLTEKDIRNIIKESVVGAIMEAKGIKSKKLYDIIQQHGGIVSNRGIFDLHNLTDNDVVDVLTYQELHDVYNNGWKQYAYNNGIDLGVADMLDYVELNDGNYLLLKLRGGRFDTISKQSNAKREKTSGDFELLHDKTQQRNKKYPRKTDYVWNNKDAEEVFHNPFFRKGEGNWTPEEKQRVMNNLRNHKRWFEK